MASLSPPDDLTNVDVASNLDATFNANIALTGTGTITVTDTTDGSSSFTVDLSSLPSGDATIAVTGSTLTIDPTLPLEAGTAYAVQISDDAIVDTLTGNKNRGEVV